MTALKKMAAILAGTEDPAWIFAVDGFEPMMESSVESRFAISNGFWGVRGARSTTRGERWVIPARTYVAGLFNSPGVKQATQALVPAADWLGIRIGQPDGPLVRYPRDVPLHRMTLDMRRGALLSESHHLSTPDIGLCVRTLRLVSMSDHAVGQTAAIDLSAKRVGPTGGIHIAAQGGIWMLSVLGFAGLSLRSDGISIDPHLPTGCDSVAFSVKWRGWRVKIRIDQTERRLDATIEAGEPMILFAGGKPNHLACSAASSPIS